MSTTSTTMPEPRVNKMDLKRGITNLGQSVSKLGKALHLNSTNEYASSHPLVMKGFYTIVHSVIVLALILYIGIAAPRVTNASRVLFASPIFIISLILLLIVSGIHDISSTVMIVLVFAGLYGIYSLDPNKPNKLVPQVVYNIISTAPPAPPAPVATSAVSVVPSVSSVVSASVAESHAVPTATRTATTSNSTLAALESTLSSYLSMIPDNLGMHTTPSKSTAPVVPAAAPVVHSAPSYSSSSLSVMNETNSFLPGVDPVQMCSYATTNQKEPNDKHPASLVTGDSHDSNLSVGIPVPGYSQGDEYSAY